MKNIFDKGYIPPEARLYAIVDEHSLLTRRNCKNAINAVIERVFAIMDKTRHRDDSAHMQDSFFEVCYLELIYNFAQFVQTLPDVGASDNLSILERSLARAAATLSWFSPQAEAVAERYPALGGLQKLVYVVFSSALLYEIGLLEQERVIHITNHFGHFIRRWDPIMGAMEGGSHYKIRYRTGWTEQLKVPLTYCFAKQLIPSIGLLWISDSPQALALWFSLMTDAVEGWMGYGLHFAWHEIESLMREYLAHPEEVVSSVSEETLWGEIFWDWLKNSINNNELSINQQDSIAHLTEHGLLVDADIIYENFNKYMSQAANKVVIYKQFNHMGLVKLSGGDMLFDKYFSEAPYSILSQQSSHLFATHGNQRTPFNALLIDGGHSLLAQSLPLTTHVSPLHARSWLASFMQRFGIAQTPRIDETKHL